MKNIIFLLGKYPSFGGTEKVTTVVANSLFKKGYGIHIVSFEQTNPELLKELDKGIKLHKLSYPVFSDSNIEILRHVILKYSIQYIINQWCLFPYVTKLCNSARKGFECKLISVHHNVPNFNARIENARIRVGESSNVIIKNIFKLKLSFVKFATNKSLSYVYKNSDKFVLLSESFVPILSKQLRQEKLKKLVVISNPITVENNNYKYNQLDKKCEIVYVGRIDYNQKKIHRIVEFWSELEDKYPDWSLKIVGDGPKRKEVEKLIEYNNLKNISITGFKSPEKYYENASILVLVSEYEGFGLVITEGMSYGVVPVVYGSYPSIYDIIDTGQNGIITSEPYNKKDMVNELTKLIDEKELRNKMAIKAIEKSFVFSLEHITEKWIKIIN